MKRVLSRLAELIGMGSTSDANTAAAWAPRPPPAVPPAPRDQDSLFGASGDDSETEVSLGCFVSRVVGLAYYRGGVNSGEYLRLKREPKNLYDPNAIRVDNMRGRQVGHIRKEDARRLAPLLDSGLARITAVSPNPKGYGRQSLLVAIAVSCGDAQEDEVQRMVDRFGLTMRTTPKYLGMARIPGTSVKGQRLRYTVENADTHANAVMDALLETMAKREFPEASPPESLIPTPLYKHQKQALGWMLQQETEDPLPPFWEHRDGSYHNSVTEFTQTERPRPIRGGILADDMGLGKTLTVLSLMITNRPKGNAGPRATLVVCPLSVLSNWSTQIKNHINPEALRTLVYHNMGGTILSAEEIGGYDVVITTYSTLVSKAETLSRVQWHRVCLDEAQYIKNTRSKAAQAAGTLKTTYRWVITGTPLQNRIGDLYSLIKWLRVTPFDEHMWWRRAFIHPLSAGDRAGIGRLQMLVLSLCLRRTKRTTVDGKLLIDLPEKRVQICKVELGSEQRHLYEQIHQHGRATFENYVHAGTVMQNYRHILEMILRLRQMCLHPELCITGGATAAPATDITELIKKALEFTREDAECSICLDIMDDAVVTPCAHMYCRPCIIASLRTNPQCPLCRGPVEEADLVNKGRVDEDVDVAPKDWRVSEKLKLLVHLLRERREAFPTGKSVVFSQFTRFMDLISRALDDNGIPYYRIDGSVTAARRAKAIEDFTAVDQPAVMLCSLKAAGTGINLIAASSVYIMDPWWNGFTEDQAMDRVHRLGQKEPVTVTKFICEGTVEESIVDIQERKYRMAEALAAQSESELRNARMSDVSSVFGLKTTGRSGLAAAAVPGAGNSQRKRERTAREPSGERKRSRV